VQKQSRHQFVRINQDAKINSVSNIMSKIPTATIRIDQAMKQRDALFCRFAYDSNASLKFILEKSLPLPGHVLEIGTGNGRFRAALAKQASPITILDLAVDQQRVAKIQINLPAPRQRIRYVIHGQRLPWDNATFNSVVTVNTFHLLARPHEILAEMVRVLKPNGKLVVCDIALRGFQIFNRLQRIESRIPSPLKHGLVEIALLL
jgi:ubiquinone/menaquinone biosynthesis C-methylase UbiE